MSKASDDLTRAANSILFEVEYVREVSDALLTLGMMKPANNLRFVYQEIMRNVKIIRDSEIEILNERLHDSCQMTGAVLNGIMAGSIIAKEK